MHRRPNLSARRCSLPIQAGTDECLTDQRDGRLGIVYLDHKLRVMVVSQRYQHCLPGIMDKPERALLRRAGGPSADGVGREQAVAMHRGRVSHPEVDRSAFAGFRFPPEVIVLAVRWYLRYGLSYRDLEELLAERGIEVDHVTVYRWVQRFTPLLIDAAPARSGTWPEIAGSSTRPTSRSPGLALRVPGGRPARPGHRRVRVRAPGHRRRTAVLHRALTARRRRTRSSPTGPARLADVIEELIPAALHNTDQYANNRVEADHGRLKARLRPMRGLKTNPAGVVIPRTRLRPEPPPRPLRTRSRRPTAAPVGHRIRRTRTGNVTCASPRPDACHVRHDATDPPVSQSQAPRQVDVWRGAQAHPHPVRNTF